MFYILLYAIKRQIHLTRQNVFIFDLQNPMKQYTGRFQG